MTFLNPLFLIGLIAAAIPVILHLLNLRKLKVVEFSTLKFLKELQKTKIRRLKIKQIILLILRTLIIISIVLAFARPTVESSLPLLETTAKTSAVILIDNSFSMDISDEFGNRLNQAKNIALSIIKAAKDGDEYIIIPLSDVIYNNRVNFSKDLNFINSEISKISISYITPNLEDKLRFCSSLLEKSDNISKEVFIISDAQQNIFQNNAYDSLKLFNKSTSIFFIPIGINAKTEIQNLSIDSINVLTKIFQQGKLVEIEGYIKNNSNKDFQGVVVSLFFNNERVAQRAIDINSNQTKLLNISAVAKQTGANKAYIEVEGDALDADNKRYFNFIIPNKPIVALVCSDNSKKYLEIALNSKIQSNSLAEIKSYSLEQLPAIDLTQHDLLICSEGLINESDYKRVEQYVRNGGSVLFFADDSKNTNLFKTGLNLFGFNLTQLQNFPSTAPASFNNVDKIHPIFEGVFKGTTDSKQIVESPKIYKALPATGGQVIIEMSSGAFLLDNRVGDGKALYFAVAPTTDWSSFPLTGIFPTLIYRTVLYLSFRDNSGNSLVIGNPFNFVIPNRLASSDGYRIITPDNIDYLQQSIQMPSGSLLSLDNLNSLGTYIIKNLSDKVISLISVNINPTESQQNFLSATEISEKLQDRLEPTKNIIVIEDTKDIQKSILRARTGSELWQLFVILALFFAIFEMIVSKSSKKDIIQS